ncbi:hypothetical protein GCM10008959_15700 [Deinococcus seoulensis]|uniref:Uncharacterized protein n=1 Tax=Deinococcus seoulensis TaxID=1837379 RepID=A0ABQ2RRF6_9DEIO|nr:hypothetical protein GCM10008959_15700 [Deinococcus seoulensis]
MRLTADMHGARTALPVIAAFLRAGQVQPLTQHVQQGRLHGNMDFLPLAVHRERKSPVGAGRGDALGHGGSSDPHAKRRPQGPEPAGIQPVLTHARQPPFPAGRVTNGADTVRAPEGKSLEHVFCNAIPAHPLPTSPLKGEG